MTFDVSASRVGVRVCKDAPRDWKRCGCGGPTGIKGEMGDRLDQFFACQTVLERELHVKRHLVGAVERHKTCNGDEAAIAGAKLRPLSHIAEQHGVGVFGERRRDVGERVAGFGFITHALFSCYRSLLPLHLSPAARRD